MIDDPVIIGNSPLDPDKPLVLLLGSVDHEGILSSLKSSNRQYKKKLLESTPHNWNLIANYFTEHNVSCVVAKLSPDTFKLLAHPKYEGVREKLFTGIASVANQVFVFEDVLLGRQSDQFREEYKPYPPQELLESVIAWIKQYQIKLIPYRKNAEVTVLAESFLEDTERNLIFRLYLPRGKIWSSEADKFLQLFQDYLSKVDCLAVRMDQRRTDFGVIYEFHGDHLHDDQRLSDEFRDFSRFMDLCASNIDAAINLLSKKNLNTQEVTKIISKYAKEARRLQLDLKQESESKLISIRHRIESELIDLAPTAEDWHAISLIIESAMPALSSQLPSPSQALQKGVGAPQQSHANIIYNIRPQFIHTVNGIVAEEVHGNQHFGTQHHQLLKVVSTHAGENSQELEAAVYELADNSGKRIDRLKAGQKIKGFLIEVGKRTGDVAFSILQKYVEKQLGL